jgi:hypothetical protein
MKITTDSISASSDEGKVLLEQAQTINLIIMDMMKHLDENDFDPKDYHERFLRSKRLTKTLRLLQEVQNEIFDMIEDD